MAADSQLVHIAGVEDNMLVWPDTHDPPESAEQIVWIVVLEYG